ncbi:alpha/beta hydrolase [Amycolatopsis cihanbeyliensis]
MWPRQGTVPVEGGELYYEARGAGDPVLLVQGALGEAGTTAQLADVLAEHYLVISYDRRGLSRSTVRQGAPPVTLSRHAADASVLLAELAAGPAHVVGASIGALVGLQLAVDHPDRVGTLVAHEPPMATVVADAEREAALDRVAELGRTDVRAAVREMAALTGAAGGSAEPGAQPPPPVGDLDTNLRHFFAVDFPAVRGCALDAARIAAVPEPVRIVPTGGAESRGQWEYRCAERLAGELGRELVELPGGHNALPDHPLAIAAQLRRLFAGDRVR